MANANLEGLQFNIDVKVDESKLDSLKKLAGSLATLQKATQGITGTVSGLNQISNALNNFGKSTNAIPEDLGKSLSKLSTSMKNFSNSSSSISKATSTFKSFTESLKIFDSVNTWSLVRIANSLQVFGRFKGFQIQTVKSIRDFANHLQIAFADIARIPNYQLDKFERIVNLLLNAKGVKLSNGIKNMISGKITDQVSPKTTETESSGDGEQNVSGLGGVMQWVTPIAEKFRAKMAEVGGVLGILKSTATLAGRGIASVGKGFGNMMLTPVKQVGGLVKGFGNLFSSIQRIAMYRAIRFFFAQLTGAIREGVKNLYQYSAVMGTTFKGAMDSLASSFLYLKNSMGAMVSPLMEQIAQAVKYIIDEFVELINIVNQFFAMIGGSTTYTVAKRTATEFADTIGGASGGASKAADELKRTLLGFDEINALAKQNSPSGGGGGGSNGNNTDYSTMFEEKTVSTGMQDLVSNIKKLIENEDWQGLGVLIGGKVNDAINAADWGGVGEKIGKKIDGAVKTAYYTLDTIDFSNFGSKIASSLNGVMSNVDFSFVGRLTVKPFTSLVDTIVGFLGGLDWHLVGKSISDFIKGGLTEVTEWFKAKDWKSMGTNVVDSICEFFGSDSFDVLGIIKAMFTAFTTALGSAGSFVWGFATEVYNKVKEKLTEKFGDPDSGIGVNAEVGVQLKKDGWTSYPDWIGVKSPMKQSIRLTKWNSVWNQSGYQAWIGIKDKISQSIQLKKWNSVWNKSGYQVWAGIKDKITQTITLAKGNSIWNKSGYEVWSGIKSKISQSIELAKTGAWSTTTYEAWIGVKDKIVQYIQLVKWNQTWSQSGYQAWLGVKEKIKQNIGLNVVNSKGSSVSTKTALGLGGTFSTKTKFTKVNSSGTSVSTKTALGLNETFSVKVRFYDSSITGGNHRAKGGVFSHGMWSDIPQYASGGVVHGSAFVAGEAGAELVGHIGGRTEVLNASQLASVMYSSVVAGMSAISGFWESIDNTLINCANGIIYNMNDQDDTMEIERQNSLLREQNNLLRQIRDKDNTVEITTNSINAAQRRKNLRDGKTVVPVY